MSSFGDQPSRTVKKFDFRCCIDEDFEDIQYLLQSAAPGATELNTTQQWYCLEANETGDELLAIGRLTVQESQPVRIDLVRFSPLSIGLCNTQQVFAHQYFMQKLTHVSQQFVNLAADGLGLLLNDYDESFVFFVASLGWQEKGGYFSTELNSMVHEFVFCTSTLLPPPAVELEFEVIDDSSIPDTGMKNLMESLFSALHKEEGEGNGLNS